LLDPTEQHESSALLAMPDDALLDCLQKAAFGYFLETVNPVNGLVRDASRADAPASIAVVGFALSCYPIAVERGWMTREQARDLALTTVNFFHSSLQGTEAHATGYKGFYYHFLDIETGQRVWNCELSMIDTALLIAGMLTAAQYFSGEDAKEAELRERVETLYRRVDWRWSQGGDNTIRLGWKPECKFMNYGWDGYNEAIILYMLASGSPTHPLTDDCYATWTLTYQWENIYGQDLLYAGPLFAHQFSHAWIDFRGVRDDFMREKKCDYFENSRRAVRVQREYANHNPGRFKGYDTAFWGLTACDGPEAEVTTLSGTRIYSTGYAARGAPYGPDDGTVGSSAVLASLPFEPDIVLQSLRTLIERYPSVLRNFRFTGSINPSMEGHEGAPWVSKDFFGLDQGIGVMMIENHRTGFPWRLMEPNVHFRNGLKRAGFRKVRSWTR
jgi:hypothetical protein